MSSLNSSGGSNRIYDHRPIIPATNSTSTSNPTPSIPIPSFPSTTLSSSHPHPHPQQSQQPQQPPQPQHSNSSITTLSSILPSSTTHPSTARLHDLLEFVRAEFDQVSAESFALRNQREEYEQMINHHANELNAMRQMSYELEKKHCDLKLSYDAEIDRMKRALNAVNPSSVPPPPSTSSPLPGSGSHQFHPSVLSHPTNHQGSAPQRRTSSPGSVNGATASSTGNGFGNNTASTRMPPFLSSTSSGPGTTMQSTSGGGGGGGGGGSSSSRPGSSSSMAGNNNNNNNNGQTFLSSFNSAQPMSAASERERDRELTREGNANERETRRLRGLLDGKSSLPPLPLNTIPPYSGGGGKSTSRDVSMHNPLPGSPATNSERGLTPTWPTTSAASIPIATSGSNSGRKRARGTGVETTSTSTSASPVIGMTTLPSGGATSGGAAGSIVSEKDKESSSSGGDASLKKEGSDWITMFNPNVKRVLDVGLVHTLVHDSVVCCVKFSPDGKILATGCNRNTTLYDTKTGARITTLIDDAVGSKVDNYIRSASFSPDGKLLATGSEDRIVRIWNIASRRLTNQFRGHTSEIYSLAFSPDGLTLASGSGDRTAKMWSLQSGLCLYTLAIDEISLGENGPVIDAGVTSVVLSPDGHFLAAASLDTMIRIWDARTGALVDKLKGHKDSVYSVAFDPEGKWLVSGSLDKTLKMWDMDGLRATLKAERESGGAEEGDEGRKGKKHKGSENGDAEGEREVKMELDKEKESVGAIEGGKTVCTATLMGHKDYVLSVAVSPDGAWIVSGSKDRGVQFWDPTSTKAQFMLQGHKNSVISVAVADVGGLVATGSGDWSARIWSYETI